MGPYLIIPRKYPVYQYSKAVLKPHNNASFLIFTPHARTHARPSARTHALQAHTQLWNGNI